GVDTTYLSCYVKRNNYFGYKNDTDLDVNCITIVTACLPIVYTPELFTRNTFDHICNSPVLSRYFPRTTHQSPALSIDKTHRRNSSEAAPRIEKVTIRAVIVWN